MRSRAYELQKEQAMARLNAEVENSNYKNKKLEDFNFGIIPPLRDTRSRMDKINDDQLQNQTLTRNLTKLFEGDNGLINDSFTYIVEEGRDNVKFFNSNYSNIYLEISKLINLQYLELPFFQEFYERYKQKFENGKAGLEILPTAPNDVEVEETKQNIIDNQTYFNFMEFLKSEIVDIAPDILSEFDIPPQPVLRSGKVKSDADLIKGQLIVWKKLLENENNIAALKRIFSNSKSIIGNVKTANQEQYIQGIKTTLDDLDRNKPYQSTLDSKTGLTPYIPPATPVKSSKKYSKLTNELYDAIAAGDTYTSPPDAKGNIFNYVYISTKSGKAGKTTTKYYYLRDDGTIDVRPLSETKRNNNDVFADKPEFFIPQPPSIPSARPSTPPPAASAPPPSSSKSPWTPDEIIAQLKESVKNGNVRSIPDPGGGPDFNYAEFKTKGGQTRYCLMFADGSFDYRGLSEYEIKLNQIHPYDPKFVGAGFKGGSLNSIRKKQQKKLNGGSLNLNNAFSFLGLELGDSIDKCYNTTQDLLNKATKIRKTAEEIIKLKNMILEAYTVIYNFYQDNKSGGTINSGYIKRLIAEDKFDIDRMKTKPSKSLINLHKTKQDKKKENKENEDMGLEDVNMYKNKNDDSYFNDTPMPILIEVLKTVLFSHPGENIKLPPVKDISNTWLYNKIIQLELYDSFIQTLKVKLKKNYKKKQNRSVII